MVSLLRLSRLRELTTFGVARLLPFAPSFTSSPQAKGIRCGQTGTARAWPTFV